jgi:hypothetical protein
MSEEKSDKNLEENQEEKLPFAKAEIIRLMKENLSPDRQIKERVKVEMNNFLYGIMVDVCRELEKYPYATIDYEMFKECIYPYTNIKQINQERMRILMHLNAIKSDCDALAMDVEKTLRIKDTNEKDDFSPLTGKI